jgi:peptidoglycan/xylan/chitin deacetylase (PgdA/CDA1 family)
MVINGDRPYISFTFDDFPRSALMCGGAVLSRFGLAGTYYVSMGLLGKESPSGRICVAGDLKTLVEEGHELGCHTFSHCHSWETASDVFEESIVENRVALRNVLPDAEFKSLSFPIGPPRPSTKAKAAKHFLCCRGGGQTFNARTADLNHLSSVFLEKSRHDLLAVRDVIDRNRASLGWLIFSTHDISEDPSPFGCTPAFFEEVVRYAVESGAIILPVVRTLENLRGQ